MSTPVATVADALIAFILSLLRDPAAVEEFDAAPKAALASNGLSDACAADVQAVKPVIVDNPTVIVKHAPPPPPPPPSHDPSDDVIREIRNIVNQFTTIDARTTIVDQSTNQNIWADGDVTQIFDQDAVVASGDDSVAAGDDATIDDSDSTITTGDIAVGNTTGSHNTTSTDASDDASAAAPSDPAAAADTPAEAPAPDAAATTPEPAAPVEVEAEPAALMDDLTATDGFAADEPLSAPEPEPYPEDPAEEQ
jgi:hypothetical protein